MQATADPFGAGFVSQISNLYVNNTIRNDNAIYYDTPKFYGVQLSGVYQLGESTTDSTTTQKKRGNDRYGAGITFANGPIFAGAGYEQIRSNLDNFRVRTADADISYDFGFIKPMLGYWRTRNDNSAFTGVRLREQVGTAGVTVPFGAFSFLGQFSYLRDRSTLNSGVDYGTPRARNYGLGVRYSLSKRTILYAGYSRDNLKTGTQGQAYNGFGGLADASNSGLYTAANLGSGATSYGGLITNVNPYSYQFGMRHSF